MRDGFGESLSALMDHATALAADDGVPLNSTTRV